LDFLLPQVVQQHNEGVVGKFVSFFVANVISFLVVKGFENWLRFDRVIVDNTQDIFWDTV